MKKVQVVVRRTDRDQLLEALHELGVLHITPVNLAKAVASAEIALALDSVRRAEQIVKGIEPTGNVPNISAQDAVNEVLKIQRTQAEYDSRLTSLFRQLEQQAIWGDLTLDDFEALKSADVLPTFYLAPRENVDEFKAEFVSIVGDAGSGKVIVAVLSRMSGHAYIPEAAEPLPTLMTDNPTIRAEAAQIDAKRKQTTERLSVLAHLLSQIESLQADLEDKVRFSVATNGAFTDEELFAIQGWVPVDHSETLGSDLESRGIVAGIRILDPEEEEIPPTLIKYPRWVMPIKGLFNMLNTYPGYREIDLAVFFMIAMPVFAAMLTGDGGYGLVFMLPGILFYKKLVRKMGREGTQLLIIFGAAAFIWGILTANFFGVTPETMARAGGFFVEGNEDLTYQNLRDGDGGWAIVGKLMMEAPLWRESAEAGRELLIKISFLIGSLHLIVAHLRRSAFILPDTRGIANIGWATVLVAMLGLIWGMFFEDDAISVSSSLVVIVLAAGMVLVVGFGSPDRNPIRRVGVGIASSLLPLIAAFSDTMSYIRLMAVSLASFYIAEAFNTLGATVADSATWAVGALVVIFGHTLNMALVVIAIFAHGVRLNMLEFSNNAGVEWAGYAYNPFSKLRT